MNELDRPYHSYADLFPLMEGPEFEALKVDIAANGLLEAIWLHPDGSIIDGRNRHRASIETGIPVRFQTWNGQGSLVSFIVSMNLHRRHLTSSQRAVIALGVLPMLETEAKERQAHGQTAPGRSLSQIIDGAIGIGKATEQAAQLFQTNPSYISDAKIIQQQAPDLAAEIKTGTMTIPQAKRELVKRSKRDAPPLPSNKYRVFYADPPWTYGNAGIIGPTDNYGHVQRHYPSMTIDELCAMGPNIRERAEENAVLFLWVTSPLLEECFAIIGAWGFHYKTSFVWDKVRHNFGHYNSVRHELLLVCTNGSCTPDVPDLIDSVQTIERSDVHSEKPEEFRNIIDRLYPIGRRIELFARKETEGWDIWSNEGIQNL